MERPRRVPRAGREAAERPPRFPQAEGETVEQPPRCLSSPACGGGREGASGRAARQGPSRREALPQPLPQAGGGRWSNRLGSSEREGTMEQPPRFPQAEGRRWSSRPNPPPPPLAGEAGRGPAAVRPRKARRVEGPSPSPSRKREGGDGATASAPPSGRGQWSSRPGFPEREGTMEQPPRFLQVEGEMVEQLPRCLSLPRLRGRPGGGQRPFGSARPAVPRDPPPAPPASGLPHAHIWHLICIGVWVCALGVVLIPCV